MIYVRALWGDPSVVTYGKARWDVKERSSQLPADCDLRIVAYGEHNRDYLWSLGFKNVICVQDELPKEYREINPDRPTPESIRRPGTIRQGVMMWWRKIFALKVALMTPPHGVDCIWLDWDTKIIKAPDEALYQMLYAGPPLQGCECPWKTPRAPWRTGINAKWGFHGGAYYIRGRNLIQRAIMLHAGEWAQYSDETVFSYIWDHDLIGQPCENHRFYRCRKNKPGADVSQAYFAEGDVMRWQDAPV